MGGDVDIRDAMELVEGAVLHGDGSPVGRVWADLGAGSGTFTFALARLLGDRGRVVAVDREEAALAALRLGIRSRRARGSRGAEGAAAGEGAAPITPALGDFREMDGIEALRDTALDGALFANALHFDPDPGTTLAGVAPRLGSGGRLVVVEYQDRPPNPWVPHPLPVARLREVAAETGLTEPRVVGERPSSYGGVLYCAWLGTG